jgi:HlyD family secretion protein
MREPITDLKRNDGAATGIGEPPAGDAVPTANLPAVIPARVDAPSRRRWGRPLLLLALLLAGLLGGLYWWLGSGSGLPAGIARANGRIEADEIDIDTKFAGRIAEILADEGDMVKAGQVLARMDVRDLRASLAKAEAQVLQALQAVASATADLEQQKIQLKLAEQQMQRSRTLFEKGYATKELLDQRQSEADARAAAVESATARIRQAQHALDAARQDAALVEVNIADNTLIAPRDGRIQYRLANTGEVLGVGGKVFTMLDTAYVYMDVFLPTAEAGRVVLGDDARIVLDALPDLPIPAKVTSLATQAQFTPKTVETKSERDKLMFRVRVRIDPELLRRHAAEVRAGLPGTAHIRLDPRTPWPATLMPNADG